MTAAGSSDLTFYSSVKPKWDTLGLGQGLMQKLGQGQIQIATQAGRAGEGLRQVLRLADVKLRILVQPL